MNPGFLRTGHLPTLFSALVLMGALGGVGGFYLAASLGYAKQLTGGYAPGLALFAGAAGLALLALTSVSPRWRRTFLARAKLAAA